MDAASSKLPDLDGLSVEKLKALLREQHTALQEKHAQLVAKDALLRSYTIINPAVDRVIIHIRERHQRQSPRE
jgi:hypothetical protein